MGGGTSTLSKLEPPKDNAAPVTDNVSLSAKLFPAVNTEVGKLNDGIIVQKELPNGRSYRVKKKAADTSQDGVSFVGTGPLNDRVKIDPPSQLPLKARGSQQMVPSSSETEAEKAAKMAAEEAAALSAELGDDDTKTLSPTITLSDKQEQANELSLVPAPLSVSENRSEEKNACIK